KPRHTFWNFPDQLPMSVSPDLDEPPRPPSVDRSGVKSASEKPALKPCSPRFKNELAQLIQERVWLHVRRRKAWLDFLFKETVEPGAAEFFRNADDQRLEQRWQIEGEGRIWNDPIHGVDAQLTGPVGDALRRLSEVFALSQPELDLIQACVAQQLDSTLGQVF